MVSIRVFQEFYELGLRFAEQQACFAPCVLNELVYGISGGTIISADLNSTDSRGVTQETVESPFQSRWHRPAGSVR